MSWDLFFLHLCTGPLFTCPRFPPQQKPKSGLVCVFVWGCSLPSSTPSSFWSPSRKGPGSSGFVFLSFIRRPLFPVSVPVGTFPPLFFSGLFSLYFISFVFFFTDFGRLVSSLPPPPVYFGRFEPKKDACILRFHPFVSLPRGLSFYSFWAMTFLEEGVSFSWPTKFRRNLPVPGTAGF